MNKYEHLRAKAIELRNQNYSLTEITKRLALPTTTIYYWIKKIPLQKTEKPAIGIKKCAVSSFNPLALFKAGKKGRKLALEKWKKLRDDAYNEAFEKAGETLKDLHYRDFTLIYLGEGYRKDRNKVSVANSNPNMIEMCHKIMLKEARNKVYYTLQIHIDNDENELKEFWATKLGIDKNLIKIIRKSNSGNMSRRKWRSVYGVITVASNDTYFRSRVQAWMDYVTQQWEAY